jgi:hypothetical protein
MLLLDKIICDDVVRLEYRNVRCFMDSDNELKTEIEEVRYLLNAVAAGIDTNGCNYESLLDISTRMDKLILDFIKSKD